MRTVHTIILILMLFCTGVLYAQSSQEAINATTTERLRQLETSTEKNSVAIAQATAEMAAMRSSLDRFTGLGLGIGVTLTSLQGLLIIITYRNGGSKGKLNG